MPTTHVLSNLPGQLVTALLEDSLYRIDKRAIPRCTSHDSRRNIPESWTPYTDFRRNIPDSRYSHSDSRHSESRSTMSNNSKRSHETSAPSRDYRSMGARPKITKGRAPTHSRSSRQPGPPAANASRLTHQDLEVGSILNLGSYYLIHTTTSWASSEVDPLVDQTRMRQTHPAALRQTPSAAAGSAQTAAPAPPKVSTSRIPPPTTSSKAAILRPVPNPQTSLSVTLKQSGDRRTVRNPSETRLATPARPALRARSRTQPQPLSTYSFIHSMVQCQLSSQII